MDNRSYVAMLTRALTRGESGRAQVGPIGVFFVMVVLYREHPEWWSVDELQKMTGFDEETIAAARQVLPAVGVACLGPGGRGIRLTESVCTQLDFWDRTKKIGLTDLVSGSSSSFLPTEGEAPLPLPTDGVGSVKPIRQSVTNHPDLERLAGILMTYGCPPGDARGAVQSALDDGDALESVELQALLWIVYMRSPLGESIRFPSFVARRIEQNVPPPSFAYRVKPGDPDWRRWQEEHAELFKRIRALGGPRFVRDVGEEWAEFLNRDRDEGEESESDDGE